MVVEDFLNVQFSCDTIEHWVIDPDVDSFSGKLFAVLIYYFEMGYVGMGLVV